MTVGRRGMGYCLLDSGGFGILPAYLEKRGGGKKRVDVEGMVTPSFAGGYQNHSPPGWFSWIITRISVVQTDQ